GIDLVREQIRVAEGHRLEWSQTDLVPLGAALEVRLYAEDPSNGFLPASGPVDLFDVNDPEARVDSGVATGGEVSIHYDPMIAKIITHGQDRAEAIRKMIHALERTAIAGLTTNREFLIDILGHSEFQAGHTHTHFIAEQYGTSWTPPVSGTFRQSAALVAALTDQRDRQTQQPIPSIRTGFRNNPYAAQWVEYRIGDDTVRAEYTNLGGGEFRVNAGAESEIWRIEWPDAHSAVWTNPSGLRHRARVEAVGSGWFVLIDGQSALLEEMPRFPDKQEEAVAGGHNAPMPGKVLSVRVAPGDRVSQGDVLLILEAMKMEQSITADTDGEVAQVLVSEGEQVDADQPLIILSTEEDNA
ncbi:MAG: biotin/lipoyl-binding protein, partial [Myxococcales bacterium]|nr:biotin/lipoyl-binding protein [Myxococcales bacterium]